VDEGNTVPTKKEKKAAREAAKAAARAQAQYRNEHRADPLPVGVSMVVLDKDFAAVAVLLYKLLMVPRGSIARVTARRRWGICGDSSDYVAVQASSCSTGQVLMTRATGTPHE